LASILWVGFPEVGPLEVVRKEVWRGREVADRRESPVMWGGVSGGEESGDLRAVLPVKGSGRRVFVAQ
jgi:hypothetical protein